jgi:hypothetical protein
MGIRPTFLSLGKSKLSFFMRQLGDGVVVVTPDEGSVPFPRARLASNYSTCPLRRESRFVARNRPQRIPMKDMEILSRSPT